MTGIMRRLLLAIAILFFASAAMVSAAEPTAGGTFARAVVTDVVEEGEQDAVGTRMWFRTLRVRIADGPQRGTIVEVRDEGVVGIDPYLRVRTGDAIVVERAGETYHLHDRARLRALVWILIAFLVVAVTVGRLRAVAACAGLAFSIVVLLRFIVPRIAAGASVTATVLVGSALILVVSLTLAHGFRRRTAVALVSTMVTLGIATGLASLAVAIARLSGLGSEEAFFLADGPLRGVDLRGLLLGGMVIGTLGILDDITTGQAAVVEELAHANPSLRRADLYRLGRSVGQEHIAALVNTIALAYAGAALPLFLLFTAQRGTPFWVVANSEAIAQEIVRTVVGSIALILAVPITTAIAAWIFRREPGGSGATS
jgi:uncharacterized membrane protein